MAVTGLKSLKLGNASSFLAGLTVGVGSLLIAGNIITDRSLNATPSLKLGTGSYLTYTDYVCTNTGGLAKYSACYVANPFTGTGVVHRVHLEAEANPSNTPFDCGVVSALSSSGTQLRNNGGAGSGHSLIASTGSVVVPPGWYIKCAAGSTPGTQFDAKLKVWMSEYHIK